MRKYVDCRASSIPTAIFSRLFSPLFLSLIVSSSLLSFSACSLHCAHRGRFPSLLSLPSFHRSNLSLSFLFYIAHTGNVFCLLMFLHSEFLLELLAKVAYQYVCRFHPWRSKKWSFLKVRIQEMESQMSYHVPLQSY